MGRLSALAAGLGGALLVRQNAVVLVPVVLGIVAAVCLVRVTAQPAPCARRWSAVIPLALVWVSYRVVDPTPVGGAPRARFDGLVSAASAEGPLERAVLAVPMPIEWRAGFAYLVETADERPAYLLGRNGLVVVRGSSRSAPP